MRDTVNLSFASAFAEAMTRSLCNATNKLWSGKALALPSEIEGAKSGVPDASGLCLALSFTGALEGSAYLELPRAYVLLLGSQILDQPASIFGDEHAEALLDLMRLLERELNVSLEYTVGGARLSARRIEDVPVQSTAIASLEMVDENENSASAVLSLDLQLQKHLMSARQPQVEPQQSSFDAKRSSVTSDEDRAIPDPQQLGRVIDVPLNVVLRFGQRQLPLREILDLNSGSLVELDRKVEEPVDLMLDGRVIARGEVVIVDGNYGLRVTEISKNSGNSSHVQ